MFPLGLMLRHAYGAAQKEAHEVDQEGLERPATKDKIADSLAKDGAITMRPHVCAVGRRGVARSRDISGDVRGSAINSEI